MIKDISFIIFGSFLAGASLVLVGLSIFSDEANVLNILSPALIFISQTLMVITYYKRVKQKLQEPTLTKDH